MHYYSERYHVSTIADVEAIEKVTVEDRRLPASTYEMLKNAAEAFPDKAAIIFVPDGDDFQKSEIVSYRQLLEGINQTANLLHALGVTQDDAVGILMPNTIEAQFAIWGSEAAGIACSVNWMLEPEIVANLFEKAGIRVLIAFGPSAEFDIWPKVAQIRRLLPGLSHVIQVGCGESDEPATLDFASERQKQPSDRLINGRVFDPSQTASLFHTGGTTGVPKLARHTHGNEVFMSWITAIQQDVTQDDVRVVAVPLFHVTGVLTQSLMPLTCGASLVMLTAAGWRNPTVLRNIWSIVAHHRITALSLVPTVVNMMLNIPVGGADISSLKLVSSGTAPLSVNVAHAFEQLTGAVIMEAYGLTETTALCATNPRYGQPKIGSVGYRFAYEELKAVVVDAKGQHVRDCAPDEAGVIVARGPNVFPGYLDASQTASTWVKEGWLNTGDIGFVDDEGYCFLTGRAKDLIIRGGNNIDPRLIEEAFFAHPMVADAAAIAMPDSHAGELPVVFVSPKPGCQISTARLKFYAYERIPERAAVPKTIYVLDKLPMTAVGKVKKNELRLKCVELAQRQALSSIGGVSDIRIDVRESQHSGAVSEVALRAEAGVLPADIEDDVRQALIRFTIPWTLTFLPDPIHANPNV